VALVCVGTLTVWQGQYAAAGALLDEALAKSLEAGDKWSIAECFFYLGILAENCGDADRARSLFERTVAIRNELGQKLELALALALNCLGRATSRRGDPEAARLLHVEALAVCQKLGARDGIAQSLSGLADLARLTGNRDEAL